MKCGYARVSTDERYPAVQLIAANKIECETVFKDDPPPLPHYAA